MGFLVLMGMELCWWMMWRILGPKPIERPRRVPSLEDEDAWIAAGGPLTFEEWSA